MKVTSILYGAFALFFSLQGSITHGMDLQAVEIPTETAVAVDDYVPPRFPNGILPWDVIKIIFKEYLCALDLSNHEALKKGLGTLMDSCGSSARRTDILEIVQSLYGPSQVPKLILACEVSNRFGVAEWISKYPNLKNEFAVAFGGTTPLISTIRNKSTRTFFQLLNAGSEVINGANENGYTPLMAAADQNHSGMIRELLAKKAHINALDIEGFTALHRAVEKGNYAAAEALLVAGANPNIRTKKEGFTPLYIAIMIKNVALVRLLLHHKANPNTKTHERIAPLMNVLYAYQHLRKTFPEGNEAELKKLVDIAQHLLQSPTIQVNEPGLHGVSPLAKALECAVGGIAELLTAKGALLSNQEQKKQVRNDRPRHGYSKTKNTFIKHN